MAATEAQKAASRRYYHKNRERLAAESRERQRGCQGAHLELVEGVG